MGASRNLEQDEHQVRPELRSLADRAFSRTAGAPLIGGNRVRLLKDAEQNYLEAIGATEQHIHFESYIIHKDKTGEMFADALIAKARQGVRVRLIYDWMGGLGKTSHHFALERFGFSPMPIDPLHRGDFRRKCLHAKGDLRVIAKRPCGPFG